MSRRATEVISLPWSPHGNMEDVYFVKVCLESRENEGYVDKFLGSV